MLKSIGLCIAVCLLLVAEPTRADDIEKIVFITASLTYDDGKPPKTLGTGTGFVISKNGFVVTAKHVIPSEVPAGATLVLKGSLRGPDGAPRTLIPAQNVQLGVDITLLRFDPNAQPAWEYLKISSSSVRDINLGESVVAWGFAANRVMNRSETKVSALMGPENTVQVGAGIVSGMSGGPVVNTAGNVIGVITGGAVGQAALTYFTPISLAKPLISEIAEFVDDRRPAPIVPAAAREPISKTYDIAESRNIGALQSKEFSITYEAVAGRKIGPDPRFVTTSISGVSGINLSVAPDGKTITLKYVVNGGQNGSGTLIGNILTEQK